MAKIARIGVLKRAEDSRELQDGDLMVLCNARTGEILEYLHYDARPSPLEGSWIKVYQRMAAELAESGALRSAVAYRVLLHLLSITGYGNDIVVNQSELAQQWGVSRSTVSRAVTSLVKLGLVESRRFSSVRGFRALFGLMTPIAGRFSSVRGFRLNPNFGWKGQDQLRKARAKRWAEEHQPAGENPDLNEGTA